MSTITEFLLARIAEDEAQARDFEHDHALAINGNYSNWDCHYGAPAEWATIRRLGFPPARILAECAAKRAIIERHPIHVYLAIDGREVPECAVGDGFPCDTLQALAAVYANHPDYQAEWALDVRVGH